MSVKIMGMVWDLDNEVISREEKFVLLAYTDHADHEGNNMFPSIALICKKTGYKERAAQLITKSLAQKGFLIPDGKGPKGTNKWSYGWGAENAGVQKMQEGGAKNAPLGVQQNAPEPSETSSLEPSLGKPPKEEKPKPQTPNEIKLFREVTERYPNKVNFSDVSAIIQGVSKRLGRECTADDLRPFYAAWCGRAYNKMNLAWLSWAESGVIPDQRPAQKVNASEPRGFDAGRKFLERQGFTNG